MTNIIDFKKAKLGSKSEKNHHGISDDQRECQNPPNPDCSEEEITDVSAWAGDALLRIIEGGDPVDKIITELGNFSLPTDIRIALADWLTCIDRLKSLEADLEESEKNKRIAREYRQQFQSENRQPHDIVHEIQRSTVKEIDSKPAYFFALYQYLLEMLEDMDEPFST